jgi:hypothetical protein
MLMQVKSKLKSITRQAWSITSSNTGLINEFLLGQSDLGHLESWQMIFGTLQIQVWPWSPWGLTCYLAKVSLPLVMLKFTLISDSLWKTGNILQCHVNIGWSSNKQMGVLRIMGPQINRGEITWLWNHTSPQKGGIVGESTSQEKMTRLGFEPKTSQIYTRCSNH